MAKEKLIQIRVSDEQKFKIEEMAKQNGLTVSAYLLMLAMRDINTYKGDN